MSHGSQQWWPHKNYRRARTTRMASAQMSMPIARNIIISECRRIYSIILRLSSVQYATHPPMPRTTASTPFTSNRPRMAGTYQNRVILKCNGKLVGHKIKLRGALWRFRTLISFLLHANQIVNPIMKINHSMFPTILYGPRQCNVLNINT